MLMRPYTPGASSPPAAASSSAAIAPDRRRRSECIVVMVVFFMGDSLLLPTGAATRWAAAVGWPWFVTRPATPYTAQGAQDVRKWRQNPLPASQGSILQAKFAPSAYP